MNRINYNRAKNVTCYFLLVMGVAVLAACGGGGGSKSSPVAPDTTPKNFTFTSKVNVARDEVVTSVGATITGINTAATVTIVNGEYSIGGHDFVSTAGLIESGQTIKVRILAASGFDEIQAAELTIGGVKATFSVTTEGQDTAADPLAFSRIVDAEFGSEHTSEALTVMGINDTAEVTITNGYYAIGEEDFTDEPREVNLHDTIRVRGVAGDATNSITNVTLAIGGANSVFSIFTIEDIEAPSVVIAFPPPISKTAHDSVMIRGMAEDDYNGVESVQIAINDSVWDGEILLDASDNVVRWEAQLPLVDGDNNVDVVVVDGQGNEDIKAASVKVVKEDFDNVFPHEGVNYASVNDMLVYERSGSLKILTSDYDVGSKFIEVDLATGVRSEVPVGLVPEGIELFYNMVIDEKTNLLYTNYPVLTGQGQAILAIDMAAWTVMNSIFLPDLYTAPAIGLALDTSSDPSRLLIGSMADNIIGSIDMNLSSFSPLSTNSIPDALNQFDSPGELTIHPETGALLVLNGGNDSIINVDLGNGARTIKSSAPQGETWSQSVSMAIDVSAMDDKAFVSGYNQNTLLSVNMETGKRTFFSEDDTMVFESMVIATHPELGYILGADTASDAIFAIDLQSGQRVVITKSN